MEQKSLQELVFQYLGLFKRGRYFVIVPLFISLFLGSAIAFKLPKVYRSEAKMFYMQAQLPDWAKLEVMNMYLEAMLIFIEALAVSPDQVNNLIKELDLYPEKIGRVPNSDLIDHFKKNYALTYTYTEIPSKYGKTEEIITGFSFSFDHEDGKKAYYVVNALATSFIELFRKFRESTSARSETFFEAERERLRREIALIDQQIANFKQKHVNELPELFQMNYSALENLNQKIFMIDQKLMEQRDRRRALETQLSTINPVLGMTGISGERIVTPQERLAALTAELGQLRARYSDRHPDVRRTQNEIAELEAILKKGAGQNVRSDDMGAQDSQKQIEQYVVDQSGGAFNPTYRQFIMQLEEVKAETENLKLLRSESEKEVLEYERRVGMTPLVEKEWSILERDRQSAQKRFTDLASQVQTMESAAEMEKRELGGRLTIGQPPVIPLQPDRPDIPLIIGASAFLGFFFGVGLLLGWDYLSKTVRVPHDLVPMFAPSVLVELPMVQAAGGKASFRKVNMVYVRIAVCILLIGVVVAVDLFYMKVDVLIVKIVSLIKTKFVLTGL